MFFEDIFKLWQRNDLLSQAISDTNEMLTIAEKFYITVSQALFDNDKSEKLDKEIVKKKDYLLNHFERSIRKKTFEHMTVSDKKDQNLYSGVVLLFVSGDIERLGDYCKNIFEVVELRDNLKNQDLNIQSEIYLKSIKEMFENTIKAFSDTNTEKAKKVINKHYEIKTSIDIKLAELAVDKSGENFAIYALLFRYLKRLSSHLRNISTSISNPIDQIGYHHE